MSALVLRGDARSLPLPDESVDLIVTSPPYYALRSYTDGGEHMAGQVGAEPTPAEYVRSLLDATAEWCRVLKLAGSLFVNLGDKYAGRSGGPQGANGERATRSQAQTYGGRRPQLAGLPRDKSLLGLPWRYALGCVDELGLILRAEVIWSKPNGLPESVTDRVRRSHETWFHLTREPRYYSAVDEIREPHVGALHRPGNKAGAAKAIGPQDRGGHSQWEEASQSRTWGNPLGALPGSVWTIPTEPLTVPDSLCVDHFAAFPTEWPRRLVLGWSPAGGTVLDPFGGTGTTALVASVLGRTGITVDRSADYCRLAAWRTTDPGQRARAMRLPKPPVETVGQADLFAVGVA